MSEIERLFGTLSFEDATVGKMYENTQRKRPKTAVPRLRLGAKSPTRYQEVLKTEREIHRQPSSKALITMIVMRLEENLKLPFF